jgi:hypothetical protein
VETALEKAGVKLKSLKNVMNLDSTEAIKSAVEGCGPSIHRSPKRRCGSSPSESENYARRGLVPRALGGGGDLHRTYVGGIERALRNGSMYNIAKLAHAFGVPIAELFSRSRKCHKTTQ